MEYYCYIGRSEQYRYTRYAENFKDLKKRLKSEFNVLRQGRWYKNPDLEGYPTGAQRFIIKAGPFRSYLLIVPK